MTAETQRRTPLERVPPHDDATERNVLGAALLHPHAAAHVAGIDADIFYRPAHQHIAHVIADLYADASPTDPGTVAAVLRTRGLLDQIGGPSYLTDLQGDCTNTAGTPKWVDILTGYQQRRRTLGLAGEIVDAVYRNTPTDGLVAELHSAANASHLDQPSTWEPVNLVRALAGEGDALHPTLLERVDGQPILYPGKVHSFVGEPEGGKSWLALLATIQAIAHGQHVLYVDFEADDVTQTTRLLELGVDPTDLLERFHYIRPDDPHDKAAALRLTAVLDAWRPHLVVLDGVAEALSLNGWDENSAADVTRFYVQVARPLARYGAAVVTIDHVVKDKESQGRYARGSTAKLAAIDGAVYKVEVVKPFGRGLVGSARIVVNKDRHGHIRAIAGGGKHLGVMRLDSTHPGVIALELTPPDTTHSDGPFRPTGYMEKVSRELESIAEAPSANAICSVVGGKKTVVLAAIRALIDESYVDTIAGPRGFLHRSVKPYREVVEQSYSHDDRTGE